MAAGPEGRNARGPTKPHKGGTVGLLRRKDNTEPEPNRCPLCNERVPDDSARECAMCGADLRALLPSSQGETTEAAART